VEEEKGRKVGRQKDMEGRNRIRMTKWKRIEKE
jgi:hypothetical protein